MLLKENYEFVRLQLCKYKLSQLYYCYFNCYAIEFHIIVIESTTLKNYHVL